MSYAQLVSHLLNIKYMIIIQVKICRFGVNISVWPCGVVPHGIICCSCSSKVEDNIVKESRAELVNTPHPTPTPLLPLDYWRPIKLDSTFFTRQPWCEQRPDLTVIRVTTVLAPMVGRSANRRLTPSLPNPFVTFVFSFLICNTFYFLSHLSWHSFLSETRIQTFTQQTAFSILNFSICPTMKQQ